MGRDQLQDVGLWGGGEQGHMDNIKVNVPKGEMAGLCAYERQLFKMVLEREAGPDTAGPCELE